MFGDDVACGSIAALDRGVSGERYMLDGRPQDVMSIAAACNRLCAIAGVDHHVEDLDATSDPVALEAEFGPTLMAIATKARVDPAERTTTTSKTSLRLGYDPVSLDVGLEHLAGWLRGLGRIS